MIVLKDLPKRERTLSPESISEIFGGCKSKFVPCDYNRDCCSSKCHHIEGGLRLCS